MMSIDYQSIAHRLSKQAGSLLRTILVSGHSGSGKSTLAERLATRLQQPLVSLDKHPAWHDLFRSDPESLHLIKGTPERKNFLAIRKMIANDALSGLKEPTIVEGTQLVGLPFKDLARFARVYVSTPLRQLLDQRIARVEAKALAKQKPWDESIRQRRYDMGRRIYNDNYRSMLKFKNMPGTLHYRTREDSPEDVINLLQKQSSEYVFSRVDDPGDGTKQDLRKRFDVHLDNKNVAYLVYRPESFEKDGPFLSGLYVSPEHRRQGLAKKLVTMLEREHKGETIRLLANPYKDKNLSTQDLVAMYKHLGFDSDNKRQPARMSKKADVDLLTALKSRGIDLTDPAQDPTKKGIFGQLRRSFAERFKPISNPANISTVLPELGKPARHFMSNPRYSTDLGLHNKPSLFTQFKQANDPFVLANRREILPTLAGPRYSFPVTNDPAEQEFMGIDTNQPVDRYDYRQWGKTNIPTRPEPFDSFIDPLGTGLQRSKRNGRYVGRLHDNARLFWEKDLNELAANINNSPASVNSNLAGMPVYSPLSPADLSRNNQAAQQEFGSGVNYQNQTGVDNFDITDADVWATKQRRFFDPDNLLRSNPAQEDRNYFFGRAFSQEDIDKETRSRIVHSMPSVYSPQRPTQAAPSRSLTENTPATTTPVRSTTTATRPTVTRSTASTQSSSPQVNTTTTSSSLPKFTPPSRTNTPVSASSSRNLAGPAVATANSVSPKTTRQNAIINTVRNPTTYNGIRVNNQAAARNKSLGQTDRQELANAGFGVTPGGVIQRTNTRRSVGGGTFGVGATPSPGQSGEQALRTTTGIPTSSVINPQNVVAGRSRYGLAADGTSRMPAGRRGMIMARTDISDEQKQMYLNKLDAYEASKGRNRFIQKQSAVITQYTSDLLYAWKKLIARR
jgi:ribosomal protein S18 acetylase RimI-like enzyme